MMAYDKTKHENVEAEGVEDIDKGSSCGYMKDDKVQEEYLPWTPRKNPVWSEDGKG